MSIAVMTLVNGIATDQIDIADRGLNYGDGLFETMVWKGKPSVLWPLHYARLQHGCKQLDIPTPTREALEADIAQVTSSLPAGAIVKIIITRGKAMRGYAYSSALSPNRIVQAFARPTLSNDFNREGVAIYMCQLKLATQPRLAGIKHLNRLEQILARAEQPDEAYPEGLLCDQQDNIIEAIAHNIFIGQAGKLYTPRLDGCGVAGVMRHVILEQAAGWGITIIQEKIHKDRLAGADEVFLCNSIQGIWPVRSIDGQTYPLGPMTQLISNNIRTWLPWQ